MRKYEARVAALEREREASSVEYEKALSQARRQTASLTNAYRAALRRAGLSAETLGAISNAELPRLSPQQHRRLSSEIDALAPTLTGSIRDGSNLEYALVDYVRSSARRVGAESTRAGGDDPNLADFVAALLRDERHAHLGLMCQAVLWFWRRPIASAAEAFAQIPVTTSIRLAPIEYSAVSLLHQEAAPEKVVAELLAGAQLDIDGWLSVLGQLHSAQAWQAIAGLVDQLVVNDLDEDARRRLRARRRWAQGALAETGPRDRGEVDTPTIAVYSYGNPNEHMTSTNLGHDIQSLAALSFVLRHDFIKVVGDDDMVDISKDIRAVMSSQGPSPALESNDLVSHAVRIACVDRDAASLSAGRETTFLIATGAHSERQFGAKYDFPFPESIVPLFIGFHCASAEFLTEETVSYLCKHGPVGCRDWHTMEMLTQFGVPVFFSGCISSTLGGLFSPQSRNLLDGAPTRSIDTNPGEGNATSHERKELLDFSAAQRLREALGQLHLYHNQTRSIVSSRLTAHMAALAMGVATTFKPRDAFDPRFDGLAEPRFAYDDTSERPDHRFMAERIEAILAPVVRAVAHGGDAAEVRRIWNIESATWVSADRASLMKPADAVGTGGTEP